MRSVPTTMSRKPARELLEDEGLDDVIHLDVVAPLESDAALQWGGHLAHVVLEAAQGFDPSLPDGRAVPHQARARAPLNGARDDLAAGDGAGFRGREDLTYLGGAEHGLADLRLQEPGHRVLHIGD